MTSGHPSFFGNGLTHRRDVDMEHYNTHPSLNGDITRGPRFDNPPYNAEPADFDTCMYQIQHWMGQARSMCAVKYQSFEESSINEQILLDELHNKDNIIDQLRKELMDESQKGQRIVHRLEKELHMMVKLVEGYRESIRGTQKAFDEYRARSQQANEPYYKDVPGSKGLVMSVVEVEKKQLKLATSRKDDELKCLTIDQKHFSELSRIESYDDRLLCAEENYNSRNGVLSSSFHQIPLKFSI